jgi:hypothetical protein
MVGDIIPLRRATSSRYHGRLGQESADAVPAGYYERIGDLIAQFPDAELYATRCFVIDAESVMIWVSARVEDLEVLPEDTASFYYKSAVQCTAMNVRRSSYGENPRLRDEPRGRGRPRNVGQVVSPEASVVSPEVMAHYPIFPHNDNGRLARTAENIRDICCLHHVFASRYPDFSRALARQKAAEMARHRYEKFVALGDPSAARINHELWSELTPFRKRAITRIRESALLRRFATNSAPEPEPQ